MSEYDFSDEYSYPGEGWSGYCFCPNCGEKILLCIGDLEDRKVSCDCEGGIEFKLREVEVFDDE